MEKPKPTRQSAIAASDTPISRCCSWFKSTPCKYSVSVRSKFECVPDFSKLHGSKHERDLTSWILRFSSTLPKLLTSYTRTTFDRNKTDIRLAQQRTSEYMKRGVGLPCDCRISPKCKTIAQKTITFDAIDIKARFLQKFLKRIEIFHPVNY